MSDAIIVAIITSSTTLFGVILANYAQHRREGVKQAVRDQRIDDSINNLTKRVDAHNGMLDRVANIEKSIVRIETKLEEKQ
jgi:hypothetical protein